MKNIKRFENVEFLSEYPSGRVAEHEIFMLFNGDDEATAFWEWWNGKGSILFQKYLDNLNEK